MTREIRTHIASGNDRQPELFAGEDVAPGNAPQEYRIHVENVGGYTGYNVPIKFINLEENGITNESLLAIVIDRLERFQAGDFACQDNHVALIHLNEAMTQLHRRTHSRMERGVEGKAEA